MLRSVALALGGLVVLGGGLRAEPRPFPYKAYVNANEVYVRSGPGEDYYPTDKLKLGQEVEVYRHDPGGWYAVRPPEGSFTWVAARYVEGLDDGLATINADRVAARVGTRFSEMRDVIQVRLQKGEQVEVLQRDPSETLGEKGWCKIAPPSGEFRWIAGKFVDRDFPHEGVVRHRDPEPERAVEQTSATSPIVERHPDPPPHGHHDAHAPGPPPPEPRFVESPSVAQPAPMRRLDAEEFRQEIDNLELELSIMVAEEPTVWTFAKIGPRARALLEQADTAVQRGRARTLVSKVARFEEIKTRLDAVSELRHDTERHNHQLAELARKRGEPLRVPISVDARYDGIGKLQRLPATSAGTPRYALLDENNEIHCYVTPAPGVNLQNYVGRAVGIHGMRGFMPEQKAQHIVAKHVTAIEDTILR